MRPPVLLAAALLLVPFLPRLDAASVGVADDLPDLVARAEIVAEFQVVDARPEMLPDGSIQTAYTFSTLTPMKGRPASVLEVRLPGGEVAGRGLLLPGMPELRVGDRQILFLSAQGKEKPWRMPIGLAAGAWKVSGGGGGAAVVSRVQSEGTDVRDYREFVAAVLEEVARQQG
ncbi:MAG: hypothetical protein D6702_03395 [Planctomycetota bacterium]|nr:MAG: hypothetical protein D6702_03395 [Planctomycetota bacterium]